MWQLTQNILEQMTSIKIIGAGSIGNHIANAARAHDWDVLLTDIDPEALRRSKEEIYPGRYGDWDDAIDLANSEDTISQSADVIFVGTPPDRHIDLASKILSSSDPKVLIVEKPLCGPDLAGCSDLISQTHGSDVFVGVGYNHTLGENTAILEKFIAESDLGEIQTISAKTREHWGGIFKAHPWLSGPEDSYLGFSSRGGGACCEHSHAINIWQHFAHRLGGGRVNEVSALMDMCLEGNVEYDRLAVLSLRTESGIAGEVIQDVVTFPAEKSARIQWERGFAEWVVNHEPGFDAVLTGGAESEPEIIKVAKTRADEFKAEIQHIEDILSGKISDSPISLQRGMETMVVIAAAFQSSHNNRVVQIDWNTGYNLDALNFK